MFLLVPKQKYNIHLKASTVVIAHFWLRREENPFATTALLLINNHNASASISVEFTRVPRSRKDEEC